MNTYELAGPRHPTKHGEYADGVSPPLAWSPVNGAKSHAIIAEDPDAKPIKPFVYWVAWKIPADVTKLADGVQEQPRLIDPEGILQGSQAVALLAISVRGRPSATSSITIISRSWRWINCSTFRRARIADGHIIARGS